MQSTALYIYIYMCDKSTFDFVAIYMNKYSTWIVLIAQHTKHTNSLNFKLKTFPSKIEDSEVASNEIFEQRTFPKIISSHSHCDWVPFTNQIVASFMFWIEIILANHNSLCHFWFSYIHLIDLTFRQLRHGNGNSMAATYSLKHHLQIKSSFFMCTSAPLGWSNEL